MGGIGESEYIAGYEPAGGTVPEYFNKNDPTKTIPANRFASENRGNGYSNYNLQPMSDGKGGTIVVPVQQYSKSGLSEFVQDLGPVLPIINIALMGMGVPPLLAGAGNLALQGAAGNINDVNDALRVAAPFAIPVALQGLDIVGPSMAATTAGRIAENYGGAAGLSGFGADIAGSALSNAVKAGLTGDDILSSALSGAVEPVISAAGKYVTSGLKDAYGKITGFDYGADLNDIGGSALEGFGPTTTDTNAGVVNLAGANANNIFGNLTDDDLNDLYGSTVLNRTDALTNRVTKPIIEVSAPNNIFGNLTDAELNSLYGSTAATGMPTVDDLELMDVRNINGIEYSIDKDGNVFYIDDQGDVGSLTKAQFDNILSTDLGNIRSNALDRVIINAPRNTDLTSNNTNYLNNLATLTNLTQIDALDDEVVGAIDTSQIAATNTSQVGALDTSQSSMLTPSQITALALTTGTGLLLSDVLANKDGTTATTSNLTTLNTGQIGAVTTDQIVVTNTDNIGTLTTNQVSTLTTMNPLGLQGIANPANRYWQQTGKAGTAGQGDVRFFEWSTDPIPGIGASNILAAKALSSVPMLTEAQIAALRLTNLKGGGKVENLSSGGTTKPRNTSIIGETLAKDFLKKAGVNTTGLSLKQLEAELARLNPGEVFSITENTTTTPVTTTGGTTTGGTTTGKTTTGGTTIPVTTTSGTTAPRNTSIVDVNLARNALKKAGVNTTGLSLKQLEVELARIYPTEMFTVTPSTKNKLGTKEDIEANRQILNKALEGFVDYGDYKPDIRLRPDEVATVLRANGIDPYGLSASDMLDALHKVVGVGKSYSFESVNIADLESYFDVDKNGNYIFRETRKPYTGPTSHASSQTTGTTGGPTGGTTTAPPAITTIQPLGLQALTTANLSNTIATQNISAITTAQAPAITTAQAPAITTTQDPAVTAPVAKQYFNQSTNRYYTDPTGQWTPPAGWVQQNNFKGGGEVETQNFSDGGSIFDFDTGIDIVANNDYLNLFDMPASIDFATQLASANDVLANYGGGYDWALDPNAITGADVEQYLRDLPSENASYGSYDRTASYQQDIKDAANASGSLSGVAKTVVDKLAGMGAKLTESALKSIANNPGAWLSALAGAGLGYAASKNNTISPMGLQSLGLSQQQVYDTLKGGNYVGKAEGGEIPGYGAGGGLHYLKSAEDGMADKIPATIDNKQPARLSGGEFVVPADVVSHLGNGNSEAGAKRLYEMMDRIRHARTGNKEQGKQINPAKFTPK
jgi:hypothetical protein